MSRLVPWLVLVMACGGSASQPPQVRWGEEVCRRCQMIVSEARFAAVLKRGVAEVDVFDEVGDLVLYLEEHPGAEGIRWVHGYRGGGWLRAEEAIYVLSPQLGTPMGHGIVALTDPGAARRLAGEVKGRVLSWAELPAALGGEES